MEVADRTKLLPFAVEKQTLVLSVLHDLTPASSPVGSINLTFAHSHMAAPFDLQSVGRCVVGALLPPGRAESLAAR